MTGRLHSHMLGKKRGWAALSERFPLSMTQWRISTAGVMERWRPNSGDCAATCFYSTRRPIRRPRRKPIKPRLPFRSIRGREASDCWRLWPSPSSTNRLAAPPTPTPSSRRQWRVLADVGDARDRRGARSPSAIGGRRQPHCYEGLINEGRSVRTQTTRLHIPGDSGELPLCAGHPSSIHER